ncbi:hypothetical protein EXIGLDRAFT_478812 [Exidia glandulosa HHB12029]|uniref:Uncharacterized protein n=1 Tax=Exidia glandulosa HHB12029 TaxID=1314781 RepID=A0A166NI48_EXIGL|nr:hypothetical protein EXIGLDRAFT_478812 [Exidia glandulosa HHB12029]
MFAFFRFPLEGCCTGAGAGGGAATGDGTGATTSGGGGGRGGLVCTSADWSVLFDELAVGVSGPCCCGVAGARCGVPIIPDAPGVPCCWGVCGPPFVGGDRPPPGMLRFRSRIFSESDLSDSKVIVYRQREVANFTAQEYVPIGL